MQREEAFGLRISVAMHVALLMALGTAEQRKEQKVEAHEVELEVLPTHIPEGDRGSPNETDDNCSDRQPGRSSPEVAVSFDIADGPLSASLRTLSHQMGLAYAVDAALIENLHSSVLHGLFAERCRQSPTSGDHALRTLDGWQSRYRAVRCGLSLQA